MHKHSQKRKKVFVYNFKEFVEAKKDLAHERYVMNNRDQKEGEKFISFLTNITLQAGKCDFCHQKDSMIRDQIIAGIWSERMKVRLRDIAYPDLNTIIRICKTDEITKTRTQDRVWNNPHAGFCWFGRSSSGVDPVVSSHIRPCWHSTGCLRKKHTNQTTKRGQKEETEKHGFKTANAGRWSWHSLSF